MIEELKIIINAEVSKFKKAMEDAKKETTSFKDQVKKASEDVDKNIGAMGKAGAVGLVGLGTALVGVAVATEESRQQTNLLKSSFEAAGGTAEQATQTYNDLYRVLGDGGQATEAAQHLAKLKVGQEELSQYTDICKGVYAEFSASLPIEGLTEAINHTVKLGEVQGPLADALEWSGITTDDFNASLAECNSESEREKLIRETLTGIYANSAETYEKNNADILAQRDAQIELDNAMAALGATIAPVVTAFTTMAAKALEMVTPLLQNKEVMTAIAAVVGTLTIAIGAYNAVAAIKAAMAAAEVTSVWALVSAYAAQAVAVMAALAPYILVTAAIAALVAAFLWLWENCEGFRNFWIGLWETIKAAFAPVIEALKTAFYTAWDYIKGVWDKAKPYFEAIWNGIKKVFSVVGKVLGDFFKAAWTAIKVIWDLAQPYFNVLWTAIKAIFSVVGAVLGGFFKVAWETIKAVWDTVSGYFEAVWNTIKGIFAVVKAVLSGNWSEAWNAIKGIVNTWKEYFSGVWNSIKNVFSAVGSWFKGVFQTAWNGIKNVFSAVGSFFTNVWNTIKGIFSKVGTAIGDGIKGAVSNAVNKVLSTAVKIINGFISAINVAISVINAIPGVSVSKLNKLSVPKMAKGGIIDSATLAMIGENGKEAVVPLENNLQWLDKLAGMLNARMGGGGPIVLKVGEKVFGEIAIDSINSITKQTGVIPLVIG